MTLLHSPELLISQLNTSIARLNRMDKIGSPCLSPICLPKSLAGEPSITTEKVADCMQFLIISTKWSENPRALRFFRIASLLMEQKYTIEDALPQNEKKIKKEKRLTIGL